MSRGLDAHPALSAPGEATRFADNGQRLPAQPSKPGCAGAFPAGLPKWQHERCKRLHKVFCNIERRMANGWRLHECFVAFAWYMRKHSPFYYCEPSRKFRVSVNTLRDGFYRWKHGGKTPQAIVLRYRPGLQKLDAATVATFVENAIGSNASSYEAVPGPLSTVTVDAYRHAVAPRINKLLVKLFSLRRQTARATRAARAAIQP